MKEMVKKSSTLRMDHENWKPQKLYSSWSIILITTYDDEEELLQEVILIRWTNFFHSASLCRGRRDV